jgi:anion-transporting  ArsA/GET3 family ATPase
MDQEKMMNKLEELAEKINLLETSIHKNSNPPIIVKVDVQDLHLNELTLEELAFHLDKLDVKEISGMLNLGNTFSPRVHPKSKRKQPSSQKNQEHQEEEEKNDFSEIQVKINHNSVPYTITSGKGC